MTAPPSQAIAESVHPPVEYTVYVNAPAARLWSALTHPNQMKLWMADPTWNLVVEANWVAGGRVRMTGEHYGPFESCGEVLSCVPCERLSYTHLSSLSRLDDLPQHHTVLDFRLAEADGRTKLTLTLSQFPTEAIYKHMDLYWRATLVLLKRFVEQEGGGPPHPPR